MPNLPTVSIDDQTKWDRVFAAFNGSAADYKTWLVAAVKDEVMLREAKAIRAKAEADLDANREQIEQLL